MTVTLPCETDCLLQEPVMHVYPMRIRVAGQFLHDHSCDVLTIGMITQHSECQARNHFKTCVHKHVFDHAIQKQFQKVRRIIR